MSDTGGKKPRYLKYMSTFDEIRPSDVVNVLLTLLVIILTAGLGAIGAFSLTGVSSTPPIEGALLAIVGALFGSGLTVGLFAYHALNRQKSELVQERRGVWDSQRNLEEQLKPVIEVDSWSLDPDEIEVEVSNKGESIAENLRLEIVIESASEIHTIPSHFGETHIISYILERAEGAPVGSDLEPEESNVEFFVTIPSELPEGVRLAFLEGGVNEIDFEFALSYESAIGLEYKTPLFTIAISEGLQDRNLRNILERGKTIVHTGEDEFQDKLTRSERGEGEPRIIVVDDEEEVTDTYRSWLSDGYYVQSAYSAEGARRLVDDDVDLLISDRKMPHESGDELIWSLRNEGYEFPIVLLTAVEPDLDIIEMPIEDYITKPISEEELRGVVDAVLKRQQFDELMRNYFSTASKIAALESYHDEEELKDSEEYLELRERFNDYRILVSEREKFDLERYITK